MKFIFVFVSFIIGIIKGDEICETVCTPVTPSPTGMPTFINKNGCTRPYNLILVVDQTGSIDNNNYGKLLPKITNLLSKISIKPLGVNAALIELYKAKAVTKIDLNNKLSADKTGFIDFLKKQKYLGGLTNLPAIPTRISEIMSSYPNNRREYDTYVVIFSDGYPELHNEKISALRKKTRNAFHALKKVHNDLYFQCIGYGNKFYGMPANRAILEYISKPNSVVTLANLKPYNSFIRNLISPICKKGIIKEIPVVDKKAEY